MSFDFANALANLQARSTKDRSEEDVKVEIVDPILKHELGYSNEVIFREYQSNRLRPDFLCRLPNNELDLIVEAKDLGVNLDLRPSPSDPASRIPKVQLENYLRKMSESKHGVYGLLTNGEEWRVCRRVYDDVEWISSHKASNQTQLKEALSTLTSRPTLPDYSVDHTTKEGQAILSSIESANDHRSLIEAIVEEESEIEHSSRWISVIQLPKLQSGPDSTRQDRHFVTLGTPAEDGNFTIADIFEHLKETYLLELTIHVCGIGVALDESRKRIRACRIFMWDGKNLHTSNLFEPSLPGTRVIWQLENLARWLAGSPNDLKNRLSAKTVHKEFFDEIACWFKRTGTTLNDLRHLLRVLFTWFLKEHWHIPPEIFEKHAGISIHEQLEHLFTQTLSTPVNNRSIPRKLFSLSVPFKSAPFLNGSLFSNDQGLLRKPIPDSEYLQAGGKQRGLFSILKGFEWTLTENEQIGSDSALDPSMIGSVFERFIAIAEGIEPGFLARQPKGAYYTPQDLTDEMVCDAVANDLVTNVEGISFEGALQLLRPVSHKSKQVSKEMTTSLKKSLVDRLRCLTVLDPCTGSGQFIVSVLNTLRRAERRLLAESFDDKSRIELAIRDQLFAVDVHPMAIQVTRFRFYLALIASQTLSHGFQLQPLPNLETRVTAANSLATRISELRDLAHIDWGNSAMTEWRAIRDKFTYVHTQSNKDLVKEEEARARKKVASSEDFVMPHYQKWLKDENLGVESKVAECGLQMLFGKESWDIVIGNPPYQKPSSEEAQIAREYGYKSAKCGDLYCYFIELGLNLMSASGILTMVVPNSLCFARPKQVLRDLCSIRCQAIYLRTYNNRPTPMFPPHPFIKGGPKNAQNSQRVTIATMQGRPSTSKNDLEVRASSYIGIRELIRFEVLQCRPGVLQLESKQWPTAGSDLLVELLRRMNEQQPCDLLNVTESFITFPVTARYFITCLPKDMLDSPTRERVGFRDDELFWSRICLYNSKIFLAYWLMVGDAFHVLKTHLTSIALPPRWRYDLDLRSRANEIGREFCSDEVLVRSSTVSKRDGQEFLNFNFQDVVPELVRDADIACIEGYDLADHTDELLIQIEKVRKFETWDL